VQVREALETLSEDQKEVIDLAYFGGLTQVQISEKLGIPLGTVKTRTLAAMRKMRSSLQEVET
jgi:RNA polymerase sigma-70 factor (ECF subfamily)